MTSFLKIIFGRRFPVQRELNIVVLHIPSFVRSLPCTVRKV
ncbi:MAG: hypothetical protein ACE5HQ_02240 [Gemmatimonadota bacterium]